MYGKPAMNLMTMKSCGDGIQIALTPISAITNAINIVVRRLMSKKSYRLASFQFSVTP